MIRLLFVRPQREPRAIALSLPPLGAMYIASYLDRHAPDRVQTRILDLTVERNGRRALARTLDGFAPDVVGLSALTPEALDLTYFADWFKTRFPESLVVAGGPHANAAPEQVLDVSGVDLLCLGEGERTALALVERLADGRDYRDLPGLAYRENGETRTNPAVEPIDDLDSLPFPAWDRVPILDYCSWRVVNPSMSRHYKRFTTLFTSRSCPYQCVYCHNIFGSKYRVRSPENIFGEMEELDRRYGIREFHVVDDNFNLRPERVHGLCDRIIAADRGYRMAFVSGLRGDILTPETIDKLYAAGTYQISFGVESASDRIQKMVRRNGDIPRLIENIRYARRIGMVTHGFFIFGFPTETREEVAATERTALSVDLVTAAFHTLAPYPGTPLYDLVRERDPGLETRLEEMFFKSSTMNLSEVPTPELHAIIKRLFRRFYLRPRRLLTIWRMAPRKIDVIMNFVFHWFMDPRLLRFKKWFTGETHY